MLATFLVYKHSKRFGLIKMILMNYFVFRTSFFVFIFSPATESPILPGLSPAHNMPRAEPWKRWR